MNEGIHSLAPEAKKELTPEQEEILSGVFPDGPQTEEEKLLLNRLVVEMATGTDTIDEVIEKFRREREELLAKGGYDPKDYIIEKDGTVTH